MKILWIGDAIINSGFSIVTHNICNELCNKCELEVFGIRYNGRTKHGYPYFVYPGQQSGDIYSFSFVADIVNREKPDVVVIFNDDEVVGKYVSALSNCDVRVVPLFPVNLLPLDKTSILAFSNPEYNIPEVMTYTEFSKRKVLGINPNLNVTAIYHGVHENVFYPIPNAKKELGIKEFIVGNINANTYRKRLDLFLRGFAKFAKGKRDVKCLLHVTNIDIAYDLRFMARDLEIDDKMILSEKSLDFDKMNTLYNLMDVNVNTAMGEGFGLSLIEGASCGVPVLCPDQGNMEDIWAKGAEFIKINREEYVAGTRFIGEVIDIDDLAGKLNLLYEDKNLRERRGVEAYEHSRNDLFRWKIVATKVYNVLMKAVTRNISIIS